VTLRVCLGCTTAFAVGLDECPACRSTDHVEEGSDEHMAKISRAAGPTDMDQPGYFDLGRSEQSPRVTEDAQGRRLDDDEGGERSSAGTSSRASSGKPQASTEQNESDSPKPARTTGSRSTSARTGGSSARSTAGGPADDA
jgi:hypothetical protein